jgi:cupin fold WbuC family metalloprotein
MKSLSSHDLEHLSGVAADSPRLRAHHNFHTELADPVQRLAIAMEPGTYVRPHRHVSTWEMLCPLAGLFDLLVFDEQGCVLSRHRLGADGARVFEMPAGTWHAVISLAPASVVFEVKQGPYKPLAAPDLAPWSPAEGDPAVAGMLEFLACAKPGDRYGA